MISQPVILCCVSNFKVLVLSESLKCDIDYRYLEFLISVMILITLFLCIYITLFIYLCDSVEVGAIKEEKLTYLFLSCFLFLFKLSTVNSLFNTFLFFVFFFLGALNHT